VHGPLHAAPLTADPHAQQAATGASGAAALPPCRTTRPQPSPSAGGERGLGARTPLPWRASMGAAQGAA